MSTVTPNRENPVALSEFANENYFKARGLTPKSPPTIYHIVAIHEKDLDKFNVVDMMTGWGRSPADGPMAVVIPRTAPTGGETP